MAAGRASGCGRSEHGITVLAGGVALALVVLAARVGWLEAAELAVFDAFARRIAADPPRLAPADPPRREESARSADAVGGPPVLLLSLGEADFARHGHPIPDALLAAVLERLGEAGASAIGVDLYRPPPAVSPAAPSIDAAAAGSAGWAALAEVVVRDPRIVMAELLPSPDVPAASPPSAALGLPAPDFVPEEQVGFNDVPIDAGRVVRRGYLYAWDEDGQARVSLALRLAALHLATRGVAFGPDPLDADRVRVGATPLPPLDAGHGAYVDLDAGGYQIALDFRRPLDAFERIALAPLLEGRIAPERIAGRVVVIGTDAPSVQDEFDTPLAPARGIKGHRLHAQLVDQLIRAGLQGDRPLRSLSDGFELLGVGAFGAAAIAVARFAPATAWVAPGLLAGGVVPFVLAAALFGRGVWIPSVWPALAWLAAGGAALGGRVRGEARAQRQLVSLFRRFSSTKVADALWRERAVIMEGGRPRPRRVVLTVLMSDLVGFTTAAEKLEPERLLAWIDDYMAAMTRLIEAYGGHVDDYVGDGIKANFGVPIPSESEEAIAQDACAAVACALAMERALEACNRRWVARGWPEARQRIGIETGPAVVGAIGSETRMKYTSIGDTINRAARLEALAESDVPSDAARVARILIGEATRRRVAEDFLLEDLGIHAVKGRTEPVHVHRVVASRDAAACPDGTRSNSGEGGRGDTRKGETS
ncbi:MAG: CHASE2 domain-containing protein [Myxococcota bacterium]